MSAKDDQQRGSPPSVANTFQLQTADTLPPALRELDEVDYPYEADIRMASSQEQLQLMVDCCYAMRDYFSDRPEVYIGMDMLVYYQRYDNTKRVTPDVFVAIDALLPIGRNYRIWDAGKPPDVVWDFAPDSAMKGDPKEKKELYRQLGVPEYWSYDTHGAMDGPRLQGFEWFDGRYRKLPAERRPGPVRSVYSPLLDLELHCDGKRLRLCRQSGGAYLRSPAESERERRKERIGRLEERKARLKERDGRLRERAGRFEAEGRAQAEAQARQEAEARVQVLLREHESLRARIAAIESAANDSPR